MAARSSHRVRRAFHRHRARCGHPTGKITARTDLFTPSTAVQTVHWRRVRTVYAVVGDLFAEVCFGLSIIGLLWATVYPRRLQPQARLNSGVVSANGRR